jgi:hypothetical protein
MLFWYILLLLYIELLMFPVKLEVRRNYQINLSKIINEMFHLFILNFLAVCSGHEDAVT